MEPADLDLEIAPRHLPGLTGIPTRVCTDYFDRGLVGDHYTGRGNHRKPNLSDVVTLVALEAIRSQGASRRQIALASAAIRKAAKRWGGAHRAPAGTFVVHSPAENACYCVRLKPNDTINSVFRRVKAGGGQIGFALDIHRLAQQVVAKTRELWTRMTLHRTVACVLRDAGLTEAQIGAAQRCLESTAREQVTPATYLAVSRDEAALVDRPDVTGADDLLCEGWLAAAPLAEHWQRCEQAVAEHMAAVGN